MSKVRISLIKESKKWNLHKEISSKKFIQEISDYIFLYLKKDDEKYSFSVNFSDDKSVQDLNFKYRQKNSPTNVLSFQNKYKDPISKFSYLGDIIISFEAIEKESIEQNKSFENHFTHILIHGILHLLDYDHIKTPDRIKMEKVEIEILSFFGIKNPYL